MDAFYHYFLTSAATIYKTYTCRVLAPAGLQAAQRLHRHTVTDDKYSH